MKRRNFVKLSGAISMSPALMYLFGGLHSSALGAETDNKAFVLYNHANGLNRTCVRKGKGSNNTVIANGPLAPLAENIGQVSVVDTLTCENGPFQHGNGMCAYTSAGDSSIKAAGPSIDWTIASALSQDPLSTSSIFGMPFTRTGFNCANGLTVSAYNANQARFPAYNIYNVWKQFFNPSSQNPQNNSSPRSQMKAQLIDRVLEDTNRQLKRLPAFERQKAQQYMDSLNQLEKTVTNTVVTCSSYPEPSNLEIRGNQVEEQLQIGSEHLEEYWRTYVEISAALITCGLKNQITLLHSIGCAHILYPSGRGDGTVFNGHWHDSQPGELRGDDITDNFRDVPKFTPFRGEETGRDMDYVLSIHARHINHFWNKLKEAPTESGTMADATTLVWASDGGGKHHDGSDTFTPVILSGNGTPIKKGAYVQGDSRPLADLWKTLAITHGAQLNRFGDGRDGGNNVIPEILAG